MVGLAPAHASSHCRAQGRSISASTLRLLQSNSVLVLESLESMGVVMVVCWIMVLLSLFPASAVARLSPAGRVRIDPSVETILYLERTPAPFSSGAQANQRKSEELGIKSEERRKVPADAKDSIFGHFHKTKYFTQGSRMGRRGLVGSSPPTCRGRCGTCTPCKPVHVAIGSPHGVISETEYYPEVWRCLCGNRYYMP